MKQINIQAYCKASAEALGLKTRLSAWPSTPGQLCYYPYEKNKMLYIPWQPDKDANQQNMIEDWLIEQGYAIEVTHWDEVVSWRVSIWDKAPTIKIIEMFGKSKSIAFAKAFMSYINNQ